MNIIKSSKKTNRGTTDGPFNSRAWLRITQFLLLIDIKVAWPSMSWFKQELLVANLAFFTWIKSYLKEWVLLSNRPLTLTHWHTGLCVLIWMLGCEILIAWPYIDHVITIQCSAGKPWVLALSCGCYYHPSTLKEQVHPFRATVLPYGSNPRTQKHNVPWHTT